MTTLPIEPELTRDLVPPRRMFGRMSKRRAGTIVRYAVIVAVVVVALFPIYWMILNTFQPTQYELTYPPNLFLRGFQGSVISQLFHQDPMASWILHSAETSGVTVVVTLLLAIPGAYLLSKLRWRGVGIFGFMLLFTQLMPGAMIIVPELQFYRFLGWTNNLPALGLLYAAFNVPLGCWILKSSFDVVPAEIIDAALVDGCGKMGILRRIMLPISRPGLVAVGVVAFFGSWNDFIFASAFITNRSLYTAGLGISTFISDETIKFNQLTAAGVIFSILPVTLYMIVQRHVVRGLTAGAVK
jgi:multiple sugar transport system permease protein